MLFIFSAAATQQARPQTFSTMYNFGTGGNGDGRYPVAGLSRDSAGNLYGTTLYGGNSAGTANYGTVFKIDPSGYETVVHKFSSPDGTNPYGGLVFDSAGNVYGTTSEGGYGGLGTLFKLDPSGNYSVLHNFSWFHGANPEAGLAIDPAGNLYGTTTFGGGEGAGIVFKFDPSGTFHFLHSFAGDEGGYPQAGLVIDPAGNLYGTNSYGGSAFAGTVFKIDPSGNYFLLHSFAGNDGALPEAGLIMDPAGNLYGTTMFGGSVSVGAVFKIDPSGNYFLLHSFAGNDGALPKAGLIMDPAGNLYGTTMVGGYFSPSYCYEGCGTVFKIDPSGNHFLLHSFSVNDGAFPAAGLMIDPAANLYGTTSSFGQSGGGTVFKIALATPFSSFDAKLNITAGPHARLQLKAAFTQDSGGGAIDPVTQGMMLALGPYTATIPAGEFHMRNKGLFLYEGTINGVALQIRILQTRTNSYQAQLEASGMDLTSLANPVPVTLTIGSNTGTTQVTAAHGL